MGALYPIFADLTGRPVLVVGGGAVAVRKVAALHAAGAGVTVVALHARREIAQLAAGGDVELLERAFVPADLDGKWLVVAATDDCELNGRIFREASARRILCNVVDLPDLCTFHVPAVVRRGLLQIAVSTGGASPAMARRIRERLEGEFGAEYGPLLEALLDLRNHLKVKHPDSQEQRRQLLESFLDEVMAQAATPDPDSLEQTLERWKSS